MTTRATCDRCGWRGQAFARHGCWGRRHEVLYAILIALIVSVLAIGLPTLFMYLYFTTYPNVHYDIPTTVTTLAP